jgi:hypothetical protein
MEIEGRKITADEGKLLVNKADYQRELNEEFEEFEGEKIYFEAFKCKTIYLAVNDSADNYEEIPETENNFS